MTFLIAFDPFWVNIFIHHSCYTELCGYRICNLLYIICSLSGRHRNIKGLHSFLSYTICPIEVTAKQDRNVYGFYNFNYSIQRAGG